MLRHSEKPPSSNREILARLEDLERFRAVLENISDVIFVVGLGDGVVADAAGAVESVVGMTAEEVKGSHVEDLLLTETAVALMAELKKDSGGGSHHVHLTGLHCADGSIRAVELKARVAHFGEDPYGVLVASDVTERKRAEEHLRESEIRFRTVAEYNYDMECWRGTMGDILYVSPSSQRITGFEPEVFLSDAGFLESIIHPEDREAWRQSMVCAPGSAEDGFDFRLRRADGAWRWVSQVCRGVVTPEGCDLGLRFSIRDITSRKEMEDQLRHQALHDPLTGLANRVLCRDRIRQAMHRAERREGYTYAVVFMDLDGFKVINQSLGPEQGDALLVEVANRLRRCVRHLDTLSRFGSDEFVMVLEELERPGEAVSIVKRVRRELREPLGVGGRDIRLTASYGIVSVPKNESRAEEILQHANIAMHRAKDKGRDRLVVFSAAMLDQAVRRLDLENDMRRALGAGEFVNFFQPIVGLSDGRVQGFEVLVRWEHPSRGLVSPAEFIPLAEETGFIQELGHGVLGNALETLGTWRDRGVCSEDVFLSVNLSARQFSHQEMVPNILKQLEEAGVPPTALHLEITESAIMEDADMAIEKLTRLKATGIRVSVDDFGTGYSSMSYLKRFPLDHLKIDLSFVRTIDSDQENLEIVKAIVSLAHSLNLSVIAEGIEREVQADILRSLECECGQGYFYSRPVDQTGAEGYLDGQGVKSG